MAKRRRGPRYHGVPEREVGKSVRKTLISGILLLIILTCVGFGYTMYSDNNAPLAQATAVPTTTTDQINPFKATKPAPDARVGASINSFTSLVEVNTQASISVKTTAGATCTIKIMYGDIPASNINLKPAVADDFGVAEWDWMVDASTPKGMWPVKIYCSYHGQKAFVQTDLDVTD